MNQTRDGRRKPPAPWRGWAGLTAGLLLLLLFMFVVAPWIERQPLVRPLSEFILESGIDAGGLFYTEVEETGDAETALRNTIRFPPAHANHHPRMAGRGQADRSEAIPFPRRNHPWYFRKMECGIPPPQSAAASSGPSPQGAIRRRK